MPQASTLNRERQAELRAQYCCVHCTATIERGAKFCGECGVTVFLPDEMLHAAPQAARKESIPNFVGAQVQPISRKSEEEVRSLLAELAKERLILMLNTVTFLAVNLIGLWLALKCYHEFIGDDLTKFIMATTPFLFINSLALLCLSPMKKTKAEIYRIQQRLQFLRFQSEYHQLLKF